MPAYICRIHTYVFKKIHMYVFMRIHICWIHNKFPFSCALRMCCVCHHFGPTQSQSHGTSWQSWGLCCSCELAAKGSLEYEHIVWWNNPITGMPGFRCQHHWIPTINAKFADVVAMTLLFSACTLTQLLLLAWHINKNMISATRPAINAQAHPTCNAICIY